MEHRNLQLRTAALSDPKTADRDRQVLAWVAEGLNPGRIAERLGGISRVRAADLVRDAKRREAERRELGL